MTDKEILNEVYGKLKTAAEMPSTQDAFSIRNFIEQEWQRQDDAESLGQFSATWYKEPHVADIGGEYPHALSSGERHRGLEIDEDGTVKELI